MRGTALFPSLLLVCSTSAFAEDPDDQHLIVAMNVGTFSVLEPAHGWKEQYVYFGPSVFIHLSTHVVLVPNLVFEVAPGSGTWGFAAGCAIEYGLNKRVAFDIIPSILQDTHDGHTFVLFAAGPGVTFFLPNKVGIGFAVQGANVLGTNEWSVIPAANLAIPFP